MLKAIDDWLLDSVYQRLADWIADRYQKTSFMVARICAYLCILNLIPRNLVEYHENVSLVSFLFGGIWPCMFLFVLRGEEQRFERGGYGTMNTLRKTFGIYRIVFAPVVPFNLCVLVAKLMNGGDVILAVFYVAGSLLVVSTMYFGSCTPKPPKPKEQEEELPSDAVLDGA